MRTTTHPTPEKAMSIPIHSRTTWLCRARIPGCQSLIAVAALILGIGALGCSDLTGSQPLPAGTAEPSSYNTPSGARAMRNAAVFEFEYALPQFILDAGLISDELEDPKAGASAGTLLQNTSIPNPLDERILMELPAGSAGSVLDGSSSYKLLQSVREFSNQAIGALAAYDTVASDTADARVMRGELYAIEGYAEVMLADLFCSGVPLSTLDFEQDYTLRAGSTTAQVYQDALAKFDTALILAASSDTIIHLAQVGRGRAWLDLGQYDSAASAVQEVPNTFRYQLAGVWYADGRGGGTSVNTLLVASVSDKEGINGLPYVSSNDPRSTVVATSYVITPIRFPDKYSSSLTSGASSNIVVASGIEAQLIRAEAQLQPANAPNGPWLQTLNTLRESAGLSDTTDPGTAAGRISLLFSERAYWLFVTGHRQGDLRRLMREYGSSVPAFQDQSLVYPAGLYTAPGTGAYGNDVTAPIPSTEYTNPFFHGCLNRAP